MSQCTHANNSSGKDMRKIFIHSINTNVAMSYLTPADNVRLPVCPAVRTDGPVHAVLLHNHQTTVPILYEVLALCNTQYSVNQKNLTTLSNFVYDNRKKLQMHCLHNYVFHINMYKYRN